MSKKLTVPNSDHPSMSKLRKRIEKEKPYPTYKELKTKLEFHADGVKEVPDECPFCVEPCNEPHCPYTEEE